MTLTALYRYPMACGSPRAGHALVLKTCARPSRRRCSFYGEPFLRSSHRSKRGSRLAKTQLAVAVPAAKTVTGFWPLLVQAYTTDPAGLLLGVGACVAGIGIFILLIAALPALFALKRCIQAVELLVHELKYEVPDTAAALRLSGLEIADAVEEVSTLGSELTQGVRTSARALVSVEQGMRNSVSIAEQAVNSYMVPGLKKVIPETRDALEGALKQRAELQHSEPTLREMAIATKGVARRLRGALGATRVAASAVVAARNLQSQRQNGAALYEPEA